MAVTLNDFTPEKIQEKEQKAQKDAEIMNLLGRFSAQMLMERLRENGHPEPEFGDGTTWRHYYLDECRRRGTKILKDLDWPTDEDALYVNIFTGCIDRLIDVATANGYFADCHTISNQVWSIIEHWEPYDGTKPNQYLIKYLEEEIQKYEQLRFKKNKTTYDKSNIKKIPGMLERIAAEKVKVRGDQT